ncbi:MAG: hypothetical protein ACYCZ2_19035, partial [Lutibacter sp.]
TKKMAMYDFICIENANIRSCFCAACDFHYTDGKKFLCCNKRNKPNHQGPLKDYYLIFALLFCFETP